MRRRRSASVAAAMAARVCAMRRRSLASASDSRRLWEAAGMSRTRKTINAEKNKRLKHTILTFFVGNKVIVSLILDPKRFDIERKNSSKNSK
jgi:hypothetical protein